MRRLQKLQKIPLGPFRAICSDVNTVVIQTEKDEVETFFRPRVTKAPGPIPLRMDFDSSSTKAGVEITPAHAAEIPHEVDREPL